MNILETPLELLELVGDILGRPTEETDLSPITTFHISLLSLACYFVFLLKISTFSRHKKGLHLFLMKICNCISWKSSYNL